MVTAQILLLSILRALVEVAGFALLGQGLLAILAGASRERNVIYRLFVIIASPVTRVVRAMTPRVIIDRHIPFVSFFLLFWLWILLAYARRLLCDFHGVVCA
jgi:hypothetical protein